MAVPVEIPVTNDVGDGVTTSFPLGFTYGSTSEVSATVGGSSLIGYAIIGANCLFDVAPATGAAVQMKRATPVEQTVAFPADGAFPSKSFALQMDRLTRIAQEVQFELSDLIARSLQVPVGESVDVLPAAAERAGKYQAYEVGTGAPVVVVGVGGTGDASLVAASDGAAGALWSSVQGFINRLRSVAGAALVGMASGLSVEAAIALLAPKASPAFTGEPSISGAAGTYRQIRFFTGALSRWTLGVSAAAEAGANAGSDFVLGRNADAGGFVDFPLTVSRATGVASFLYSPTVPTLAITDSSTKAANAAFVAAFVAAYAVGQGMTRTNVTASRPANTTFTHTGTRPRFISIQSGVATNTSYSLTVGGSVVQLYNTGASYVNSLNFFAIVLPGETYSINFTVSGVFSEVV